MCGFFEWKKMMAIFGGLFLETQVFQFLSDPTFVLTNGFAEILQNSGGHFCCHFSELNIGMEKTEKQIGPIGQQSNEEIHFLKPTSLPLKIPIGWKMIHCLLDQFRPIFRRNIWFYRGYLED